MKKVPQRDDTRQRLLTTGAAIIHRKGYSSTGLQEILEACNVPKGSFYHYFKSKEDFALAIIDHYLVIIPERTNQVFADTSAPPLERLKRFFDITLDRTTGPASQFVAYGCPVGNLVQELATTMPALRGRLEQVVVRMEQLIAGLLREAQAAGQLAEGLDPDTTAQFVLASWQGAILRMKSAGGPEPLILARDFLLSILSR